MNSCVLQASQRALLDWKHADVGLDCPMNTNAENTSRSDIRRGGKMITRVKFWSDCSNHFSRYPLV